MLSELRINGWSNHPGPSGLPGSSRRGLSLLCAVFILVLSLQNTTAQTPTAITTLEVGKPIVREISAGEKHRYQLTVTKGQYFRVLVTPTDTDVGDSLLLPTGGAPFIRIPTLPHEVMGFTQLADAGGTFGIDVFALPRATPGRYEIRIAELRDATEEDWALNEARELFRSAINPQLQGRALEARPLLLRCLEIRERLLGPDDPQVVEAVRELAVNYQNTGELADAERFYIRALQSRERTYGPDHPRVAERYSALGAFYWNKGDDIKAEEMDLKALSIFEKDSTETVVWGTLLGALGNLYSVRGEFQKAESYYERSRAALETAFGPESFHIAPLFGFSGRDAYTNGEYSKAKAMLDRALALSEAGLGADSVRLTGPLNDMAMLYATIGDYDQAERLYRRALSNHEQKGAMSDPAVEETLSGLARVYAAKGDVEQAIRLEADESDLEERHITSNLAIGSERERLAYLRGYASHLSRNISLHIDYAAANPVARDLAVSTLLRRKGRVQDAMANTFAVVRNRFGSTEQKLFDELRDTTSQLANLVLSGPQRSNVNDYQKQINQLEHKREGLESEISLRSPGAYSSSHPVTLAAVSAAIPNKAALIEFVVYRPFNAKGPRDERAYAEPHYAVYVLRNNRETQWKALGPATEIDAAIDAFRKAVRDSQRKDVKQTARQLDEKILEPVRTLLGDATQLLVSPDGELNFIPFAALVNKQGQYLIEDYSITYLTSGRDLLQMQTGRESKAPPMVVANPLFGEPLPDLAVKATVRPAVRNSQRQSITTANDLAEVYFAPLNGTVEEAHAIQALFPEAAVLTGAQASESALKQAAAPRILHLATHGFFLSEPAGSLLSANPLLRSGLALTNANRHAASVDDGILTALEASNLNLWGTKLVVLSACDTGLGAVRNGEGVYGLRRAFVLAGAESLVMSLWPISDYSTRQIMSEYYKNLKRNMGRGESLRQVQLDMLKHNPRLHPFYWAHFIQSGDWSNLQGNR